MVEMKATAFLSIRLLPVSAAALLALPADAAPPGLLLPGYRPAPPGAHALVGARIVVKPGEVIETGTVIIRDGLIEQVGKDEAIPADARVWDLKGMTIYAGFIDPYSPATPAATPVVTARGGGARPPVASATEDLTAGTVRFLGTTSAERDAAEGPGYELARVTPERSVAKTYATDARANERMREIGFAAANFAPASGIIRGVSALAALSDEPAGKAMIRPEVFQHVSLEAGGGMGGGYPGSLMGVVAAVRQAFFDAQHYQVDHDDYLAHPGRRSRPDFNPGAEALEPALRKRMTVVFEPRSALMVDRAARLARELGLDYCLVASGQEWRRPDLANAAGVPFIVPLNFPANPQVPSEDDWEQVTLDELRAWDWAPENPAVLRGLGLEIALTTSGLTDKSAFRRNLKAAMDRGLVEKDALAALTTVPARLCGVSALLGTVEPGKLANLTVVDGKGYFDPESKVRAVWVDGKYFRVTSTEAAPTNNPATNPVVAAAPATNKVAGTNVVATNAVAASPATNGAAVADAPAARDPATGPGPQRDGSRRERGAARARELQKRVARPPMQDRGVLTNPPAVLVRGATIWTCGPQGHLERADLFVQDGRIKSIGPDLFPGAPPENTLVIDGTGLHITPGIIDCHSHSMILGGVNEGSLPSSAMVRIGDVVNSESPNIYEQLAGGVTVVNLLHGSANPIGGQNCVIKLRDGQTPEELKFKDAPPGIKFALGENVKQSNFTGGDARPARFPQTRMGVRAFYVNRFTEARQYLKAWAEYRKNGGVPPARDLELEALGEILEGTRLVHCHSYRQDEILMLISVAEEFGFHVATFQHVLEGYKVADEIARHGAGASTFSDWWAYKFEAFDAIPYNGALMRERGVNVSFNSDSDDLARRLYLDAAKAVKYGGVPPEEALKFVTANPARQLHIDRWVGTLEPGKDADFAIWSHPPLDARTVCQQTWIDGRQYFDVKRAPARSAALAAERSELISKAKTLASPGPVGGRGGRGGGPPAVDPGEGFFQVSLEHEFDGRIRHCED